MKITAFVPTFNEEKRIRYCLQCLKWCDEIYVLDKSSTDRTVEIAKEMGAVVEVIRHEYGYEPHELDHLISLNCDWIVLFTCSDLLDKSLALKVRNVIITTEADIIYVPFKQYALGICHKSSPWYAERRRLAFRKSVARIDETTVHGALYFDSNKEILIEGEGFMYHLTHETADVMMDRHIRYWRGEAETFSEKSLRKPCKSIFVALKNDIIRGAYWSGWDVFALACAHLAYYLMSFVYIWERKKSKASEVYQHLRETMYKEWEQ